MSDELKGESDLGAIGRSAGVERLRAVATVPGVTTLVAPPGFGATELADAAVAGFDASSGVRDVAMTGTVPEVEIVHRCDLGNLSDGDGVAVAVADAIGVVGRPVAACIEAAGSTSPQSQRSDVEDPGDADVRVPDDVDVDAIASLLSGRRALLVLSNVDQVVVGVARLAMALCARCDGLAILVTGNTPLRVEGERIIELPPIGIDAEVLAAVAAAIPDVERANGVDRKSKASAGDPVVTAALCDAAGATGLSMGLLAGRLADHHPDQIRAGLAVAGDEPVGSGVVAERDRHVWRQRRLIRWTHGELDADHRRLFDRLAVFQSGVGVAGAMAVMDDPSSEQTFLDISLDTDLDAEFDAELAADLDAELDAVLDVVLDRQADADPIEPLTHRTSTDRHPEEIIEMLGVLERAGMLRTSSGVAGVRWVMPEALRHHGLRRLGERGERSQVRNLHLAHAVEQAALCALVCRGTDVRAGFERFDLVWDDIRHGVDWAIDARRPAALDALFEELALVSQWGPRHEAFRWSRRAVDRSVALGVPLGAATLAHLAIGATLSRDFKRAVKWGQQAVDIAESANVRSRARLASARGLLGLGRGRDAADAIDALLADPSGDGVEASMQLAAAASMYFAVGRLDARAAVSMMSRAVDLAESVASPLAISVVALESAELSLACGRPDEAQPDFDVALDWSRGNGLPSVTEAVLALQVAQPGGVGLAAAAAALNSWTAQTEQSEQAHEYTVLAATAVNLVEAGDVIGGAVLFGHLDGDPRRSGALATRGAQALADIERDARARGRREAGAEMRRTDALEQARLAAVVATR